MLTESRASFVGLGVGASLAAHLVIVLWLSAVPGAHAPLVQAATVDFTVVSRPPPPEPDPVPEPEAPPPEPKKVAAAAPEAPPPEPEAPPPVADLSGLTLTNESGGSGWSSAVGDGSALERPIKSGVIAPKPPKELPRSAPAPLPKAPVPEAPPVVAVKDLSTKPVPPELAADLAKHYPSAKRKLGQAGVARVRIRIDADGKVRSGSVLSESDTGFGQACKNTLIGSEWSAPKDRSGRSVATYVRYTCRFRVN